MAVVAQSVPVPDPVKFLDTRVTAEGAKRASVALGHLRTLWFNTGTICNLTCANCYIESSPTNDRLSFLTAQDVKVYLDEIASDGIGTEEIGFTGGEPFINPHMGEILDLTLSRGFRVLVLTNAMKPLWKLRNELEALRQTYGDRLVLRVSVDHYTRDLHEMERGPRSWDPTITNLRWLAGQGFKLGIAGRTLWNENEDDLRAGYASLFSDIGLPLNAHDPHELVLFPEMDEAAEVPEITEACWNILGVSPDCIMCANSRMVVRRKGAARPVVMPCTLLPYDERFEMGETLADAANPVYLNHPHCAKFCVLGGGKCSGA